ncbi:MAG: hypothetical protein GQF41_4386 [Candidatus Rifleibacterium amylolyticum]|nr:MAG: hypothetical protein GQF41_4386 [Candidatus Rifleibacterium amylolyticum]
MQPSAAARQTKEEPPRPICPGGSSFVAYAEIICYFCQVEQ